MPEGFEPLANAISPEAAEDSTAFPAGVLQWCTLPYLPYPSLLPTAQVCGDPLKAPEVRVSNFEEVAPGLFQGYTNNTAADAGGHGQAVGGLPPVSLFVTRRGQLDEGGFIENNWVKAEDSVGISRWEPNSAVSHCRLCKKKFSLRVWRHHCRNCGRVVCGDCQKEEFLDDSSKKVKLCGECLAIRAVEAQALGTGLGRHGV